MIRPAKDTLEIYHNCSFSHTWTFTRNIAASTFYAELWQNGAKVEDFTVVSNSSTVTISLTRTTVDSLEDGTYQVGVKEVTAVGTGEKPLILCEAAKRSFPAEEPTS